MPGVVRDFSVVMAPVALADESAGDATEIVEQRIECPSQHAAKARGCQRKTVEVAEHGGVYRPHESLGQHGQNSRRREMQYFATVVYIKEAALGQSLRGHIDSVE